MLLFLYGSIVGIILGLLIDFYLFVALSFLSILLIIIIKRKCNELFVLIICAFCFFIYTKLQVNIYDTKYNPGELSDNYKIISYADEGDYYYKYICKNSKGDKFLLYVPNKGNFNKGDIVNVIGEFVLPDLSRNEGGFNYRRYLNSQKIYGSIFVKEFYLTNIGRFNFIYYIQDEINKCFAKLLPKNEMGIVLGMMIGETKDISEDVLESFKTTGITHLVAVSGSNVMYVLICVQFIFKKIVRKKKYTFYFYFLFIYFYVCFRSF